jgi:hypothetical protein
VGGDTERKVGPRLFEARSYHAPNNQAKIKTTHDISRPSGEAPTPCRIHVKEVNGKPQRPANLNQRQDVLVHHERAEKFWRDRVAKANAE